MSLQIHIIDCCSKCGKEISAPTDIFKEIDKKIKYCSKTCFEARNPTYHEKIILNQEKRLTNDTDSFLCTEDFAKIMLEFDKTKVAFKKKPSIDFKK